MKVVGILSLQGDFDLHAKKLREMDINYHLVRKTQELENISGLIIPGGESSTFLKLMTAWNWKEAILNFHQSGKALFGTCAGLILLAKNIKPEQESLGLLDIDIERNAYGRQIDSFIAKGKMHENDHEQSEITMAFIRAPKIIRYGDKIEILASHNNQPALIRENNVMGATFHPEMGDDNFAHAYFINKLVKDTQ